MSSVPGHGTKIPLATLQKKSTSGWNYSNEQTGLLPLWDLLANGARKVMTNNTLLLLLLSRQSCPTLCDPIDGSPPGSFVPGILQTILEWVAISFFNAWKVKSESEVAQSCPTLHDPMDCGLPGSSIHGIFQARVLEWGAITFSNTLLIHFKYWEKLNRVCG